MCVGKPVDMWDGFNISIPVKITSLDKVVHTWHNKPPAKIIAVKQSKACMHMIDVSLIIKFTIQAHQ